MCFNVAPSRCVRSSLCEYADIIKLDYSWYYFNRELNPDLIGNVLSLETTSIMTTDPKSWSCSFKTLYTQWCHISTSIEDYSAALIYHGKDNWKEEIKLSFISETEIEFLCYIFINIYDIQYSVCFAITRKQEFHISYYQVSHH